MYPEVLMTHPIPLAAALLLAFSYHAHAETMLLLGPGESVIDTGTTLCPEGFSCSLVEGFDAAFGRPVYQLSDPYTETIAQQLYPRDTVRPDTAYWFKNAGYVTGLRDGMTLDYCRILKTCNVVGTGALPEWKLDVLLREFAR
jgi:hypothetical protein